MREAEDTTTTPEPLGGRYVATTRPVTVRFYIPQKDRRRTGTMIEGTLRGAMCMRGAVHHYRVAGEDGVLYLAPVAWFLAGHVEWFTKAAFVSESDLGERAYINALMAKMVYLHTPEPAA